MSLRELNKWTEASISSAAVTQFAFRRKKSKTVLLVGLNGAGKTALFYQVIVIFVSSLGIVEFK